MKAISRRSFLAGVGAGLGSAYLAVSPAGASGRASQRIFAGTFTGRGSSKGIYRFRWNAETGALNAMELAAETPNPSFLALSPNGRHLYAVNEIDEFEGAASGSVSAFLLDPASGKLELKNAVSSGGAGPCNIAVDHTGQAVFVADYAGGSLASFHALRGGGLSEPVSNFHFKGHGIVAARQASAHTHCVTVSPDNRFLLVNDLGMDRILVCRIDATTARLAPNEPAFFAAASGSGPRNLAFHPSGRWAYSANEIGNTIDVLAWDSERGILRRRQILSTLPQDFHEASTAATIAIDHAGRFLYVSNRGADNIVVFPVDEKDGRLGKALQRISCGGKTPRYITLDPSGGWLLAANERSANIVVFSRDVASGRLVQRREAGIDSPVCLVFA